MAPVDVNSLTGPGIWRYCGKLARSGSTPGFSLLPKPSPDPGPKVGSIGVALADHLKTGLDQDMEIEHQAPVVDVPEIERDAARDFLYRRCGAARAIALRPSRQARLHVVPECIVTHELLKVIVVGERMRPWTDQGHFAAQDIHKLRQFINAR